MEILDSIYFWARTAPGRLAIIQSEMVTTYQGLADAIESIGERIERLNLGKREPVAVSIANPSFSVATMFALLRAGYSVAPASVALYPFLAGAGIRNVIYDTQGQVISGGRNIRFDMSWLPDPKRATARRVYDRRPVEDVSLHFFTSGTTGLPKRVVQSAATVDQRVRYCVTSVAEAHQKILMIPSIISGFGFNWACEVLNFGKTVCLAPDTNASLWLINLFGVEVIVGSPAQLLALVRAKRQNPGCQVDSLKAIFVGGGKLEPDGVARIRAWLCRDVINIYGSTEAGVVGVMSLAASGDKPAIIALPRAQLEVVDAAGRRQPAGAEGVVRMRSPQLTENLLAAGAAEIPGVREGWFYSGDIGSLDDDGVLYLSGRGSDVLNRGGAKVSTARLEEILKDAPAIVDAAACSVAGSSGFEEIWVAIVASGEVDIAALKRDLRAHSDIGLAPDEVFIVDRIPRSEIGKVQIHPLKEQLLALKRDA